MKLTPEIVLRGYAMGIFPMADARRGGVISWYAPDPRAILPLDTFYVPKNLDKLVRRQVFDVTADRDFLGVMQACAERDSTWISGEIIHVYCALHDLGFAHSIECRQEGSLVGGLYGVALGSAFFGESMFHRVSNASKVALVHLVRRLREGGFTLLDVQFSTPHLEQFGIVEIPREAYEVMLVEAIGREAEWRGRVNSGSNQ